MYILIFNGQNAVFREGKLVYRAKKLVFREGKLFFREADRPATTKESLIPRCRDVDLTCSDNWIF
jgi:hypothetical protein